MTHRSLFSLAIVTAAATATIATPATAQGRLGLLEQGQYVCALPGDANGSAWQEQPTRSFAITGASSYRAHNGASGTYLLEGARITFTRGALKGVKLMRIKTTGLLQEVNADGSLGRMRCHRAGPLPD